MPEAPIFIMRGVSIGLGPGPHLAIDESGAIKFSAQWEFWYDVAPTWLKLALEQARVADACRRDRIVAWNETDDQRKASALERECTASMQATMSAAIAVDALYASVHPLVALPESQIDTWRRKKTARPVQISETLRRAFKLSQRNAGEVRNNLNQLFKHRDMAVHPKAHLQPAVLHPELGVGIEWRFDAFRSHNACLFVTSTAALYWFLTHHAKSTTEKLAAYVKNLAVFVEKILPAGCPPVAPSMPGEA